LSAVKLSCSMGNFEEARLIVEESGDGAAAYFLAKFNSGKEAAKLLSMGGMTYQAIRIAMSRGDCDEELFEIAQKCRGLPQIYDCARYFERKGMHEQACALFMRFNSHEKALSMCLCVLEKNEENSSVMNETLISLVAHLKGKLSADVKHRIIDKLHTMGEELIMVDVICTFAIVNERLRLIFDKNVILTEEMVEMIFKGGTENKEQIRMVAIKCVEQGNHRLASKLYTMIGEKKNGMKCLIKHGNINAIISFANQTKDEDIYTLAGNYLQKLDSSDEKIKKAIVRLYSKAKSWKKLLSFHFTRAQSYAQEFGRYDDALICLKEASSCSSNLSSQEAEELRNLLEQRQSTLERFMEFHNSIGSIDISSLENFCFDHLSQGERSMIRAGDLYALLVSHYAKSGNFTLAKAQLTSMSKINIDPYAFIDKLLVENVIHSTEDLYDDSTSEYSEQSDLDDKRYNN